MLNELNASLALIINQTTTNLPVLGLIVLLLWTIFFITCIDKRLLYLGIIPRHIVGLPGVVLAPFLHANFNHLFFNTIPLVVLSNFLLINGLQYFLVVTVFITIVSGLLIWCFAKPGLHIGASAVITGYWGVLILNSVQQGTLTAIILGIVSAYYFIGILYGIFPAKRGVSWEGHLFGLIAGLAMRYLIKGY